MKDDFKEKTGDDFGDFYNQNREKLIWFLMSRNRNRALSEEIADASFAKALDKIDTFDPEKAKFSTWLFTIAKNNLCQEYKNTENLDSIEKITSDGIKISETFEYQDNSKENKEKELNLKKIKIIKKAMLQLDKKFSSIIISREIDGLSYNDIALYYGVKISDVKNRVRQARIKIKDIVTEQCKKIDNEIE